MAKPKAEIILGAKNEASPVIDETTTSLGGMGDKAVNVSQSIFFVTEALSRLGGMAMDFMGASVEMNQSLVRSVIAMDDETMTVGTLEEAIKKTSESHLDGVYSYQQVASAFQGIAAEGRGVDDSLRLVQEAMNITAITGGDLNQTVMDLETILDIYGKKVEDVDSISGTLINTWQKTGTTVEDQIPQLLQLGRTSLAVGVEFETMAATIGVASNKGVANVKGMMTAYAQMAQGSTYAKELLENYKVEVMDATGKLRPMTTVLQDLSDAGVTNADLFVAFGQRTGDALMTVIDNLEQVKTTTETSMDSTGKALEGATEYAESAAGEGDKMKSSFENLKLELSEGMLPALTSMMEMLRPLLLILTEYPQIIYALVGAWVAYKLTKMAVAFWEWAHTVSLQGNTIAQTANTIATTAATFATILFNAAIHANPLIWLALLVVVLVLVLWQLEEQFGTVTFVVEGLWEILAGLFELIQVAVDTYLSFLELQLDAISAALDLLGQTATWVWENSLKLFFDEMEWAYENVLEPILEIIEDIVDGLASAGDALGDIGGGIASGLGFKHGTDFIVGGAGGPDSQLLVARVSPGERVRVDTAQAQNISGGQAVASVQHHYHFAKGSIIAHDWKDLNRHIEKVRRRGGIAGGY